jgi:hypothetical protein
MAKRRSLIVTEVEWLTATHPEPMLQSLRGKASERKLRLFAAACCRRVWSRLGDDRSRRAIEFAESFADLGDDRAALALGKDIAWVGVSSPASRAAYDCVLDDARDAADWTVNHAAWAVPHSPRRVELQRQTVLL